MALLDEANTSAYGNPEITTVDLSVGTRPGILVSGHDLRDLEMLLEQTVTTGIDVYTHSEMLPAHYYPAFKKYEHFKGNYGNAWWKQKEEFEAFNGPILMTTNCIVPPKDSYKNRIYTTGKALRTADGTRAGNHCRRLRPCTGTRPGRPDRRCREIRRDQKIRCHGWM